MSERAPVLDVDEGGFHQQVIEASSQVPVVVDFWAAWCRPCLVLGPVLERLAGEYGGRFLLARVDVDANPGLASAYGVQGIPAVKAFKDGEVVSGFVGALPEDLVRRFLEGVVPSPAGAAPDVAREAAEAELRAVADAHPGSAVALAAAEALAGEPRSALERCLSLVKGDGEAREEARKTMVRIFELLGDEDPLVREYRPRLAQALY